MRNFVSYVKYDDPMEKQAKAIEDVRNYLGEQAFDGTVFQAREDFVPPPDFEDFRRNCIMRLGIEGYPVTAFYRYIWPLSLN